MEETFQLKPFARGEFITRLATGMAGLSALAACSAAGTGVSSLLNRTAGDQARTLAGLTAEQLASVSVKLQGNTVKLVDPTGRWLYQARYEKDGVYCETPDRVIAHAGVNNFTTPGKIQIAGLPAFTLLSDGSSVTAILPDRTQISLRNDVLSVVSPGGESYSLPVPRIPRSGATPEISWKCALAMVGMGAAVVGLIAGCALSGGTLALAITAAAGFTGFGVSEITAIFECYK